MIVSHSLRSLAKSETHSEDNLGVLKVNRTIVK